MYTPLTYTVGLPVTILAHVLFPKGRMGVNTFLDRLTQVSSVVKL